MKILQESETQLKARNGDPGYYLSSPPAPAPVPASVQPALPVAPTVVYVYRDNPMAVANVVAAPVVATAEVDNQKEVMSPLQASAPATPVATNTTNLV